MKGFESANEFHGCFRGQENSPLWRGVQALLVAMEDGVILETMGEGVEQRGLAMAQVEMLRMVRSQIEGAFEEAEAFFRAEGGQ